MKTLPLEEVIDDYFMRKEKELGRISILEQRRITSLEETEILLSEISADSRLELNYDSVAEGSRSFTEITKDLASEKLRESLRRFIQSYRQMQSWMTSYVPHYEARYIWYEQEEELRHCLHIAYGEQSLQGTVPIAEPGLFLRIFGIRSIVKEFVLNMRAGSVYRAEIKWQTKK